MIDLIKALGVFCENPSQEHLKISEVLGFTQRPSTRLYEEIFVLNLPPYASIYTACSGAIGDEAFGRISGFWRALGRDVPDEPDHLSRLLGLFASLDESQSSEKEPARSVLIRQSRVALLWEHLLPWLPMYLDRVESIGADTVYSDWAKLLSETLINEWKSLGPLEGLPIHLAVSPGLPDPREKGADSFISGLFSPPQAGFILLPDDLDKLGAELEYFQLREGRLSKLEDLLREAPRETLIGLAELAYERSSDLTTKWDFLGNIALHWKSRSRDSVGLLEQLARDLEAVTELT